MSSLATNTNELLLKKFMFFSLLALHFELKY